MRDIFLSAGHSNVKGKDMGAVGNGYIEGELAVELRELIARNLFIMPHPPKVYTDDNKNILSETLAFFKNLTKPDSLVVDIHFNAGAPAAHGTEVLIPSKYSTIEWNLAAEIASVISETLLIRKRGTMGVKTEAESHHGRLGWMRLNGENILIEVCFISNSQEMMLYQNNKQKLAKKIAETLYNYAK